MYLDYISGDTEVVHDDLNTINDNLFHNSILHMLICIKRDTCVDDNDCKDIPNTMCRNIPINAGLDPGTRSIDFKLWEPRDTLLKSCFCKVL